VRLRIVTALLLVAAAGGVLAVKPAPADTAPQLPDLDQVAPYLISAYAERRGGRTHFHLAFGSASQNVGIGRLVVVGHRSSTATPLMSAEQLIDTADPAAPQSVPGVGVLSYTRSPDHQHWHFLGFMRYELRRASDFHRVGRDRKTGFCLGDRYPVGMLSLRRARAAGVQTGFDRDCGNHNPNLLQVLEGMSPGRGDDYHPRLEGQSIEITGLPSGRYVLVHRTNADHRIRESNYANNVASALIYIGRPAGRRPPTVVVLKSCTAAERCR
jgi:hypothetical protein